MLAQHLDKDKLHHAYLLEGDRERLMAEVLKFLPKIDIEVSGNPDLIQIYTDTFRIEDARNLKDIASEKSLGNEKKVFIIGANNILREAQNSLLKVFEEPILNVHFFVIVPNTGIFLKTLLSRFYIIRGEEELDKTEAVNFLKMPPVKRLDYLKEFLKEDEEEDSLAPSPRSRASRLLDSLEAEIEKNFKGNQSQKEVLSHFFEARRILRMPGSSVKNIMESIALITPSKTN